MIIPTWFDMVFDNKSGMASRYGLVIGAKVIDASYRWEVHMHLINTWSLPQKIYRGQKVAQGIIREVILWAPEEISQGEFSTEEDTMRGEGGFGSTN
jgi:dUTP pyrophosphatase